MEDCLLWEGTFSGAGEEFEEFEVSPHEEKGVAACDEVTKTTIPHPPVLLRTGGRELSSEGRSGWKTF